MGKLQIHIHTVGCRANQADSSVLSSHLNPVLATVTREESADIVVINTCCVTTEAERDCKKTARRILRSNPNAKVIFTGCAVTAFKDFSSELGPRVISAGGGATSPVELASWLNAYAEGHQDVPVPRSAKSREYDYFASENTTAFQRVANVRGRTRALLKIQNGCTHNCTYCIVPAARGKEQSMPREMVLQHVAQFKESGAKELVFTGVQIGAWGKDLEGTPSLAVLLDDAAQLFAPGRVRLSSIEPWSVDEALIDVMAANDRICRHLHMPLQSGNDGVLDDMKRGYTAAQWLDKVHLAQAKIPHVAIGTDVICGFPTEDEAAFENSLKVVAESAVAYVHGFSYSRRSGTIAAQKWGENRSVAKQRVRRLRALGDELHRHYVDSVVGQSFEILVEEAGRGVTDTFLQVSLPKELPQTLVRAVLCRCKENPVSLCANVNQYDKRQLLNDEP